MTMSEDVLAMTFSSDPHHTSRSVAIDGMLIDSQTTAAVLREAKRRPSVQELTLRSVTIDETVARAAEDLFSAMASPSAETGSTSVANTSNVNNTNNNTKVRKRFTLGTNNQNSSVNENRCFIKLELIHCTGLTARVIRASVSRTQQLAFTGSVPIAHNPRYSLDLACMGAIGHALQHCQNLQTLALKGSRLDREGLEVFGLGLRQSKSLRTLQLSHCALEIPDVACLANALRENQHLTALSFAHCKIGGAPFSEESTAEFCRLLESLVRHPTLEVLNLLGMYCTTAAIRVLSGLVRSPTSQLWHLGLKNNIRHPEEKLQVTSLLEALETNTSLTYLQISGNNVDDADMAILGRILSTNNKTLRGLTLTANRIGDDGLFSISRNMRAMKGLRFLDVQRNLFTDKAKQAIIGGLKENMELERLDLDGTWDSMKAFYLILNKGGRRLLQSSHTTPLGLWPRVLARANRLPFSRNLPFAHLDVLYTLVRGPALFQPRLKRTLPESAASVRAISDDSDSVDKTIAADSNPEEPQSKRARLT